MTTGQFDSAVVGSTEDAANLMRSALESSTEYSMIATCLDGTIVLWNEGARRLYGYRPHEIAGQSWGVLHAERELADARIRAIVDQTLTDGKWDGTIEQVRKDGSAFTARVVSTARRGQRGEPAGFLLMASDVTEMVRSDRDLARVQADTRSLIESAPDAMVIVNRDGEIQLTNAETERLFGYSRDALIGQPVEILIPERYAGRHPDHRSRFFTEPRARPMGAGLELSGRRKDGSEFPVEISLSPLETEDGEMLVTAAIRDVTERRRFEGELRDANTQLEAANQAKDRFLASMSHELRTPLNAILGFTGTMLMELPGPLNPEQTKQLRTVRTNGRHLLSLINDLLDLARIESGKLEIQLLPVAGREVLEEVAVGLRPLAEEKGIAFDLVVPEDPVTIESDRRALSQILINLANNAIKFTDAGSVHLTLSRHPDNGNQVTRFSVIDTGRGIEADDQERMFAAFEQVGTPGSRPYEGTGLGLYICQTLAAAIGATVTFESEFGRGSTFTLELRQ